MTSRFRIAIVGLNYWPEPTGIAPYTTGAVRFLADAGHDVQVVCGYPHYPWWRVARGYTGLRRHERDGAARLIRLRHPVPRNPTGSGRIAAEAAFAAHALTALPVRPDVVIAVSPALLTVGTALSRGRKGRTAVGIVVQDLYGRALAETGLMGGRAARAAAGLERELLTRADGIVAIHETFRSSMVGMGVAPDRIRVIRNWTHTAAASATAAETRARLGWGEREIIVLHAGNIGAKQGLESVVAAARLAEDKALPLRFVLLGDGNRRAGLEELAAGCDRITFLDPLPDSGFADALGAADVLLLNERPEIAEMCVPSKLTSYFSSGRPVLAATNRHSAAAAEVTASGGGLCVEPGRPESVLDGVLDLVADPRRAARMGAAGRRYATDVLAESTARNAYLAWVDDLASGRARQPAHVA